MYITYIQGDLAIDVHHATSLNHSLDYDPVGKFSNIYIYIYIIYTKTLYYFKIYTKDFEY